MKKKIVFIMIAAACMLSLEACGTTTATTATSAKSASVTESTKATPTPTEKPLDLTGTWTAKGMEATITSDTITINWVTTTSDAETKSLYWQGSYVPPTKAVKEYSWNSENDTDATSMAMMASNDKTKKFTYQDGKLSFEASALGTTATIHMSKQ